jgi:hypothetical protein
MGVVLLSALEAGLSLVYWVSGFGMSKFVS